MNMIHRLYEIPTWPRGTDTLERAEAIAKLWCKGQGAASSIGPEYNTVLRAKNGVYYVTNRYDPRVVQWCKNNNVVPEDR